MRVRAQHIGAGVGAVRVALRSDFAATTAPRTTPSVAAASAESAPPRTTHTVSSSAGSIPRSGSAMCIFACASIASAATALSPAGSMRARTTLRSVEERHHINAATRVSCSRPSDAAVSRPSSARRSSQRAAQRTVERPVTVCVMGSGWREGGGGRRKRERETGGMGGERLQVGQQHAARRRAREMRRGRTCKRALVLALVLLDLQRPFVALAGRLRSQTEQRCIDVHELALVLLERRRERDAAVRGAAKDEQTLLELLANRLRDSCHRLWVVHPHLG